MLGKFYIYGRIRLTTGATLYLRVAPFLLTRKTPIPDRGQGMGGVFIDLLADYYRGVNGFHRAGLGGRKKKDELLRPADKQIRLARIRELVGRRLLFAAGHNQGRLLESINRTTLIYLSY
jgi:hypothetical protein